MCVLENHHIVCVCVCVCVCGGGGGGGGGEFPTGDDFLGNLPPGGAVQYPLEVLLLVRHGLLFFVTQTLTKQPFTIYNLTCTTYS